METTNSGESIREAITHASRQISILNEDKRFVLHSYRARCVLLCIKSLKHGVIALGFT